MDIAAKFVAATRTSCSPHDAALLVCDMGNVRVEKCSASLTCTNTAKVQGLDCTILPGQLTQAVADTLKALDLSASDMQALTDVLTNKAPPSSFVPGSGSLAALEQAVAGATEYINIRCNPTLISDQSVSFPVVTLEDCSGDTLTGLNQLDQTTRCAAGALEEFLAPLGSQTSTTWNDGLTLSSPVVIAALVVLFAVLVVVGAMTGKTLASKKASAGRV